MKTLDVGVKGSQKELSVEEDIQLEQTQCANMNNEERIVCEDEAMT